jgi:hypothetical protein
MTFTEFCKTYCADSWPEEVRRAEYDAFLDTHTPEEAPEAPEDEAQLFERIGGAVGATVLPVLQKLEERVAMLEEGLAKHASHWRAGGSYAAGTFVTRSGSLWHCRKDYPTGTPGDESGAGEWRLVVKRGEVK